MNLVDGYEVAEVITELADVDEVFLRISKEDTKQFFEDQGITLPETAEEGILEEGEIQISFEKDLASFKDPTEILIFPVYKDTDETCNFLNCGEDFIYAPDSVYNDTEMLQDAFSSLEKVKAEREVERD